MKTYKREEYSIAPLNLEDKERIIQVLVENISTDIGTDIAPLLQKDLRSILNDMTDKNIMQLFEGLLTVPDDHSIPIDFDVDYDNVYNALDDDITKAISKFCNKRKFAKCKLRILNNVKIRDDNSLCGIAVDSGDIAIPSILNSDIGCGLITARVGDSSIFSTTWRGDTNFSQTIQRIIPVEHRLRSEPYYQHPNRVLMSLNCYDALEDIDKIEHSFGTLGYADHCIVLSEDEDTRSMYLTVHGGCDELARQVYDCYVKKSLINFNNNNNVWETFKSKALNRNCSIIRSTVLLDAFTNTSNKYMKNWLSDELLCLDGELAAQYLHDMVICNRYASESRFTIMKLIMDAMEWTPYGQAIKYIDTPHTYYNSEDGITRCNAISTYDGKPVVFDISSDHYIIIGYGKGTGYNLFSCSSSHDIPFSKIDLDDVSNNITIHKILKPLLVYTPSKRGE